jgi:hypothetical protein
MGNVDELITALARDTTAVKPLRHPFLLSLEWMLAAAFYLGLSLLISGTRHDLLACLQRPYYSAEIAALLIILLCTSLSGALLSYPDMYQKRAIALAPIGAFTLFLALMLFAWHADSPPSPLPRHSFECTLSITALSLLPAAGTFFAMRKRATTHTRSAGGVAFLFAFSIGALWLRLHEQSDSVIHVMEWHYLPMIGFGCIGMFLGKVILKW